MDPLPAGVFRTFFESMGVGAFVADPNGWILRQVNAAMARSLGVSDRELVQKRLLELLHPDSKPAFEAGLGELLNGANDQFSVEVRFLRVDGADAWFQVDFALNRDSAGNPALGLGTIRDVTDRKTAMVDLEKARQCLEGSVQERTAELAAANAALRTEIQERAKISESLNESNRTLQTLIQASPLSIFSLDREGRIRIWNAAATKVFGWTEEEVIGKRLNDLPFGQGRDRLDSLQATMQEGKTSYFETRRCHRDGTTMDIRVWCTPFYSDEGRVAGSVAVIMDVTRQKLLQRALLEASEREQRRIGQDLHDHLCQQLLGAAFAAKALAGRMDRDGAPLSGDLHRLATVINDAVKQARDIARGLNPVELDSAGLMAALQEMAARVRVSTECFLECEHPVLLPDTEVALHAYRIAQEAVTNAVKHANATKITLKLAETQNSVVLEIADDGSGIDPAAAKTGMGIESMHYRAEAIGGQLVIEKADGGGTRIVCRFPKRK